MTVLDTNIRCYNWAGRASGVGGVGVIEKQEWAYDEGAEWRRMGRVRMWAEGRIRRRNKKNGRKPSAMTGVCMRISRHMMESVDKNDA